MTEPFTRRESAPLPEAAPDPDLYAALLWPWLEYVERCPRFAARLGSFLAGRVDARDQTVDTRTIPPGMSPLSAHRALELLVEMGLLAPVVPGRHRLVLPDRGPGSSGEARG